MAHTKTIDPRTMPRCLEYADQHNVQMYNVQTPVQIAELILFCEPDPSTRLASILGYKTPEFCPKKYQSAEVVHFDQSFCPYEINKLLCK